MVIESYDRYHLDVGKRRGTQRADDVKKRTRGVENTGTADLLYRPTLPSAHSH